MTVYRDSLRFPLDNNGYCIGNQFLERLQTKKNDKLALYLKEVVAAQTDFESREVYFAYIKIVCKIGPANPELCQKVLFSFRKVFGFAVEQFDQDIFLRGGEPGCRLGIYFSKELLSKTFGYFRDLFSQFPDQKKITIGLSLNALGSLRSYVYAEKVATFEIGVLDELYRFADKICDEQFLVAVRAQIARCFIDDSSDSPIDPEKYEIDSRQYAGQFFDMHDIYYTVRSNGAYEIGLKDFATHFLDKTSPVHLFVVQALDRLVVDMSDFSPLRMVPKVFRKAITELRPEITSRYASNFEGLLGYFPVACIEGYSEEVLEGALDEYPKNDFLTLLTATKYYENKNLDEACELIDELLTRNPKCSGAHLIKAKIAYDQERYDDAHESVEEAVCLNPNSYECIVMRARLLAIKKKFELANETLDVALALNPKCSYALQLKANSYLNLMECEKAVAICKLGIRFAPNSKRLYMIFGEALIGLKKYKPAIRQLQKVIDFDSEYDMAYTFLGKACMELQDYDTAEKHFRKALSIQKQDEFVNEVTLEIFAQMLMRKGEYVEAKELIEKLYNHNQLNEYAQKMRKTFEEGDLIKGFSELTLQ
jgi:tetratricopeptide (TPR) repeat protein